MSKYLLKLSGSNDVYNIIEWLGDDELVAPIGYIFEPFVSESLEFINAIDITDNPITYFSQSASRPNYTEDISKYFSQLTNVIKDGENPVSGLKIQTHYQSGSTILSNHFAFEDDETLVLSSKFGDENSEIVNMHFLRNLINSDTKNHIIRFTNKKDSNIEIEFLITGSMSPSESYIRAIGGTNRENFYRFKGAVIKDTTPIRIPISSSFTNYISSSAEYFNNIADTWTVDFDLSTEIKVGTFFGDFNGTIGGKKVEDILDSQGINATKYPILKYENAYNINSTSLIIPNYLDTDEAPKRNYFRFDKERGNAFWNDPLLTQNQVEELTLSLENLDPDAQSAFTNMLYDILLGNWVGSSITLRSVDYPNTYKTFRIFSAVAYQKRFRNNQSPQYFELLMGDNWRIIDTSMMLDPDFRFKNEHQYSLPNDGRITYVKLFVQEVESGMDEFRYPQHDDQFTILITKDKVKRKEVFEFTSTTTPWQVPSWADKLTIYSIGAGGGGGAGADVWYHKFYGDGGFSLDEGRINVSTADIGFEFATGGGGGAGGNVAISEFIIDKIGTTIDSTNIGKKYLPINSNLNIYVGSGGLGGQRLESNNPNHFQLVSAKDIIKNHHLKWVETLLGSKLYASSGNSNWVLRTFWDMQSFASQNSKNSNWRLQVGIPSGMGKSGGSSFVVLDKNSNNINNLDIELIKATGGLGGMHGVAIQTYYGVYHYLCGSLSHDMDQPNALGGGSYLNDSFSNKELRVGGHGGYGVSMPTHKPTPSSLKNWNDGGNKYSEFVRPLPQIKTDKFRVHLAPNIPWTENADKPNLRTPIGYNYILKQGETLQVDGWKYYENGSNEQPTKVAPLGGNGGLGANWTYINDATSDYILSLPDYFFKNDVETYYWDRLNGNPQLNIPNNWFEVLSDEIAKSISWNPTTDRPKIIGDNTLIPITDVTSVNNDGSITKYFFTLKEEGAMGGMYPYMTQFRGFSYAPRSGDPENGLHYGQGGGGGTAAYRSWADKDNSSFYMSRKGGNGASGIVIMIAEEL